MKTSFPLKANQEIEVHVLSLAHAVEMFSLVEANRDYLRQWLPWVDGTKTVADTEAFIRSGEKQLREANGFQGGVFFRKKLVGAIGLHYVDRENRRTALGYWIAQDVQGKGIASAAVKAVVTYVFSDLGLNRVEIRCAPGNSKSRAIAERLGFKKEGCLRQEERLYDRWEDSIVYGILASEWTWH